MHAAENGETPCGPLRVVLASRNPGKLRELAGLFQAGGANLAMPVEVISPDAFPNLAEVEETGTSFEENALLKARAVAEATGLIAIGDDSGLMVDALGGAPGVYSARFSAGDDNLPASPERNNQKLLRLLAATPDAKRTARFVSALAAAFPDGRHICARGEWPGVIARELKGDNGFGYDPIFFDPEFGKTAAQMSAEEKNARSHRHAAMRELFRLWPAFTAGAAGFTS